MGIFARLAAVFGGPRKKDDAVSSSRDQLTLTESRLKQQAALTKMRRGVADVSVSRQRLDLQAADLQKAMDSLEQQVEESRLAGDSGAVGTASGRLHIMGEQKADLLSQRDALAAQEAMLVAALTQLQARVAGFNVTAETLTAAQTAALADQAITEALRDFGDNPPPTK